MKSLLLSVFLFLQAGNLFAQDCATIADCYALSNQKEDLNERLPFMHKMMELANAENASDSTKAFIQVGIGLTYLDLGKFTESRPFLEKGIGLDSVHAESALVGMANLNRIEKKYAEAVKNATQAIALNPKNVFAWYNRGLSNYYSGNDEAAYGDFEGAQDLIPAYGWQVVNGDTVFSMKVGDTSVPPKFRADIHFWKGYLQVILNPTDKDVVNQFNKALKEDPKHASALRERGIYYYFEKQENKAITDLGHSVSINDKNKLAWYYLGLSYYNIKDYGRSANSFLKAIEIDPNYYDALFWEAYAIWNYAAINKEQWSSLSPRIVQNLKIVANQTKSAKLAADAKNGLKQLGY